MLGINRKEIIGRSVAEVLPHTLLLQSIKTERPLLGQKAVVKDTIVMTNVSPIISHGEIVGAVSVFQDISILEKAASELREVKSIMSDLESIINSSYDGLTFTDCNGVMLRVNAAYERMTGIKAEEIVGKNMQDLVNEGYYDQSVTLSVIKKRNVSR